MPDAKPERSTEARGSGRWAAVHLIVALLLFLAVIAVRLRSSLDDTAGLFLLTGSGVLALLLAGLLFKSFLRR